MRAFLQKWYLQCWACRKPGGYGSQLLSHPLLILMKHCYDKESKLSLFRNAGTVAETILIYKHIIIFETLSTR